MTPTLPADPTLEEIRAALAPLIAQNAAFDGFSDAALADAAARANPERVDAASRVFAGTINGSGLIEIEVTRLSS